MDRISRLIDFLRNHDHEFIKDKLEKFKETEYILHHDLDNYNVNDLKKIEKETGLNAIDLIKLVRFYEILKEKDLLKEIVGLGKYAPQKMVRHLTSIYIINTIFFMFFINEHYKEKFTSEEMDNAIWDGDYYYQDRGIL